MTPPLVIPGGSEPDWGPADVPAARVVVDPPPVVKPVVKPVVQTKLAVKVLRKSRRAVTLRVTVPGKGRLTATAKGAKVVKRVKRAGAVTLKIKSRGKSVKLAFKPASGATLTRTVKLR